VDLFQKEYFFRPRFIARSAWRMLTDGDERRKLLKSGREYLAYSRRRRRSGNAR
jgi:hypothetical protein